MATEKQRRRREKGKRHEYELVEIDADGNETVINSPGLREPAAPPKRVQSGKNGKAPSRQTARGREPKPPSWTRVLKRGAIFGPIFILFILLTGGSKVTTAGAVIQGLILMIFFVPFSYFLDRMMWRMHLKRTGQLPPR